ncbi:MAG: hypothetical protein M1828_005126 [Chrysothrix sp. TS-e1954]|nr:MAG: hypothetical protein M1828_005126 [Chrysothrix sp. TS-e1954]
MSSSPSATAPTSPTERRSSTPEETMQIFIKDVAGNTTALTIPPSTSVATIKSLTTLHSPEAKPSTASRLLHAGKPLIDPEQTLASLNIPAGTTLHLAAPVKAGMPPKRARCAFKDCKQKPALVGDCGFCGEKYCGKHRLLESHECKGIEECKDEARERNKDRLEADRTVAVKGLGL